MYAPSRRRSLLTSLIGLASLAPVFRPGTCSPGSNAPFLATPPSGRTQRVRRARTDLRRSLNASCAEGVAAEVVGACAGGAVLTGWALHLQAGPFLVGILGALPFFAQFIHIPAAWLTSRLGRRRVALVAVGLSRQVYVALALLPFVDLPHAGRLAVLLAVAAVAATFGVIGNNAWVAWMGDLVPHSLRGRYFGRRTAVCTLGGTVASLVAGLLLDAGKASGHAGTVLAALALVACVAGAVTTWLMSLQHDPGSAEPPTPLAARDMLKPLGDANARRVLAYQLAWNASVGVAGTFFAVHMLQNLQMGFTMMALIGAGTAAVRILAVPLWGRAIDRVGTRPVLIACSFGISVIPLIWLVPTPDMLWPVALDAVISGVLWSGHGLAAFALPLSVTPRVGRPFYLASFSAAGGLAFASAAAVGGMLAEAIPTHLVVLGRPMFGLQVLFVISAFARLASARLALRISEDNARPVNELFRMVGEGAGQFRTRVARASVAIVRR